MSYKSILEHYREENRLRLIPGEGMPQNIDLLSNDYLGMGADSDKFMPEFLNRFPDAGFTSSASRLLSRQNRYHNMLEEYLEELYDKPALLLNSGYHANVGLIQALAIPGTLFLADKLVHASAIDGLRLSGADFRRFSHNDARKLERLLRENYKEYERIIIIVESIYSMDGDIAPLKEIVRLKKKYPSVILYVDEAHGFGVRGDRGLGLCEELDIIPDVDIMICTLGKAAASAGAFVICSPMMKDYFINCCRSFIFSTAISPAQAAWSILMIEKITAMADRRLHLKEIGTNFVEQLNHRLNIETPSSSQIIPLIIGDAGEALNMSAYLAQNGFDALAIRRPTVAAGSERIRFSLNALISDKDINRLIGVLSRYR